MFWRPNKVQPINTSPEGEVDGDHPYRPLAVITPIEAPPLSLIPMPKESFNNYLLSIHSKIREKKEKKQKRELEKSKKQRKVSRLRMWMAHNKAKQIIERDVRNGKRHETLYVDIWCCSNKEKAAVMAVEICKRLQEEGLIAHLGYRATAIEWRLTDNKRE